MMIGVVACSKTKAPTARPAIELYQGRTYRAAVEVLRAMGCERIVILSALHYALPDDLVIEPYEQSFATMDATTRRRWAIIARGSLSSTLREIAGVRSLATVDVHAIVPAAYACALEGLPRVTRHFAGLQQGKLFAALKAARVAA
jgi:hypothetical protein